MPHVLTEKLSEGMLWIAEERGDKAEGGIPRVQGPLRSHPVLICACAPGGPPASGCQAGGWGALLPDSPLHGGRAGLPRLAPVLLHRHGPARERPQGGFLSNSAPWIKSYANMKKYKVTKLKHLLVAC